MYRIATKRSLHDTVTLMEIEAPGVARKAQPGQFIILRIDEQGERIPLTIAGYDREKGMVTIIFQKVGATTRRLNTLEEGESIQDFVGPLGKPSELEGKQGKKIAVIGGGLVGCEAGLFLQKTGHEVTVVELLGRLANESFGMYREALIWEMEKCGMAMLPKTRCLEITPTGVKVENAGGVQTLEADTVLFALGMKSVDIAPLKAAAEAAGLKTWVIGDAIQPGKVDQATRSAYLAGIEVGR